MIDTSHLLFSKEGTLPTGATRILARTAPFDHCNMTVTGQAPTRLARRFGELLRSMSAADPQVCRLFDLEGLTEWRAGRATGYAALETAVNETRFYDGKGGINAPGYTP
ncbi:MAG: hypothetical protein ACRDNF_14150 [Streptosporangiaceae bacterium]